MGIPPVAVLLSATARDSPSGDAAMVNPPLCGRPQRDRGFTDRRAIEASRARRDSRSGGPGRARRGAHRRDRDGSSFAERRGDDGPRIGCARGASRAVHGRRSVGVSHSPRAAMPKTGAEPPQGHEEARSKKRRPSFSRGEKTAIELLRTKLRRVQLLLQEERAMLRVLLDLPPPNGVERAGSGLSHRDVSADAARLRGLLRKGELSDCLSYPYPR